MKASRIFFIFLFFIPYLSFCQSLKKASKAIENKDYSKAEAILIANKDSLSPILWFTFSKLYFQSDYPKADLFIALSFANKSATFYFQSNNDIKKKLDKEFFSDSLSFLRTNIEKQLYLLACQKDELVFYEKFLSKCADLSYKDDILKRLNNKAFKEAEKINTIEAYNDFIKSYSNAIEINTAIIKRNKIAYNQAVEKNTINSYEYFIDNYPNANEYSLAIKKRNKLAFINALKINTIQAYSNYMIHCPNSEENDLAIELRDELIFIEVISKNSIDSINMLILKKQNLFQEKLLTYAKQYKTLLLERNKCIIYLSDGNLYRMNIINFTSSPLTNTGDIFSFAINTNGDIVLCKKTSELIYAFYELKDDGKIIKICELKKNNGSDILYNYSNNFFITNDLRYILFKTDYEFEIGYTHEYLWDSMVKKWKLLNSQDSKISQLFEKSEQGFNAIPDNELNLFIKKIDGVYELFRKKGTDVIQISHTQNFRDRNEWGEEVKTFYCDTNNIKILFHFIIECGDLCHGNFYLVNNDGSDQKIVAENINYNELQYFWHPITNDLIALVEDKLIRFNDKKKTKEILAENVLYFQYTTSDSVLISKIDFAVVSQLLDWNLKCNDQHYLENLIFKLQ